MINLTDPSIVIIIDLWNDITDQYIINNIIDFIDNNDFIEKVYGGIYNTLLEDYKEHQDIDRIKKPFENISKKWERISAKFGPEHLYWDAYELRLRHLVKMPHIKNIYITGFSFDQCVKTRSLGYQNLRHVLPDKNIIINKNLVSNFTEQIIEESPVEWAYIDEDHYLYHAFLTKSVGEVHKEIYRNFKNLEKKGKIKENSSEYRNIFKNNP
tara:strand:+ start:39 stop:674 length:636 start_codon:yes stop_codon:yes gene_type:complete